MSDEETTVQLKGLDTMIGLLKGRQPTLKIGILGGSPRKPEDGEEKAGLTNAQIGTYHEKEFGSRNLPRRSFLRDPITEHINDRVQEAGLLKDEMFKEVFKTNSIRPWLKLVGVVAVNIVLEAFETAGFGKWAPLAASTLKRKTTTQTLVETTQLRDSIKYRIDR